jgi:hypothetical protein
MDGVGATRRCEEEETVVVSVHFTGKFDTLRWSLITLTKACPQVSSCTAAPVRISVTTRYTAAFLGNSLLMLQYSFYKNEQISGPSRHMRPQPSF